MSRGKAGALRTVGVGMTIARNPLHGSGRAGLPHPALASGDDAKSPQGIGVTYARRGQPPLDEPAHPLPGDVPCVTAPNARCQSQPTWNRNMAIAGPFMGTP